MIFVLVLILVFILILVLVLIVLVLLLLLELSQAQVVTCLLVIGVAAQGVLIEFYRLAVILTAIGDITQVIGGLATQLLVLSALGQIGEDALGLVHRVLLVVLLGGSAALAHEGGSEVELSLLAGRVGLQRLAVLDLGLGIAFFLIQLVAVAQTHTLLLVHLGSLGLGLSQVTHCQQGHNGHDNEPTAA